MGKASQRKRPTPARPRVTSAKDLSDPNVGVAEAVKDADEMFASRGTPSVTDILGRRKPRVVITELVLDNDLLDEWTEAQEDLAANEDTEGSLRLAGGTKRSSVELAKRVQEIEDRLEAAAVKFEFHQTDPDTYQRICDSHPPREGNIYDQYAGYNRDVALDEAIGVCLVSPKMDPDELAQLKAALNPSEWKELRTAVDQANGSVSQAPKSALASQILRGRGYGSAQHEPGG